MDDDPNRPRPPEPANGTHPAAPSRAGWWTQLSRFFRRDRDSSLRETIEVVIGQHHAENGSETIGAEARSMMLNLLEFADLRVDDVMVPRADIIAIDDQANVRELLARFMDANHSRLPVYRETLDDPVGMVHIKDFMRWISERSLAKVKRASSRKRQNPEAVDTAFLSLTAAELNKTVRQTGLLRPLLFVPPSMPAADLLLKMQSTRSHMAIVVDEYGGTDGLVSIEDLVEEIVGDIADEHDTADEEQITPGEGGVYLADARASIEEVEKLLGVDVLPEEQEEDADTLGGLLINMLGRVPVRGELVRHESGVEFEVLAADPRRVRRVKIHTRPVRSAPRASEQPPLAEQDAAGQG
jgi:CBS domain containing-hemolysin-like protein